MSSLDVAISAAKAAGKVALSYYRGDKGTTTKDAAGLDFLTKADLESERTIVGIITHHFPDHSILTEERLSKDQHSPYTWIIDPIDGTRNYAHNIPVWMVAIGLSHNGEMMLAVGYDPLHDELFTAEKGKGAYLNGQPIRVSEKPLRSSVVNYNWSSRYPLPEFTPRLLADGGKIMCLRAAIPSLCYVASGRIDAAVMNGLKPWDMTAALIVTEAGGAIARFDGSACTLEDEIVATNGKNTDDLLALMKG